MFFITLEQSFNDDLVVKPGILCTKRVQVIVSLHRLCAVFSKLVVSEYDNPNKAVPGNTTLGGKTNSVITWRETIFRLQAFCQRL